MVRITSWFVFLMASSSASEMQFSYEGQKYNLAAHWDSLQQKTKSRELV